MFFQHAYCACFKRRVTCRASNLSYVPWDLWCLASHTANPGLECMDFRTLCFCRPEGLAFTAVTIFQIGTNMYKAFGGFAKFDRRYLPMTPRDSNNLKEEAKERNEVNFALPLKVNCRSNDSLLGFPSFV